MKAVAPVDRVSIIVRGAVQDPVAAAVATETDLLTDIAWFRNHPGVTARDRLASRNEILAYGLSQSAMAYVRLLDDGGVVRAFYDLFKRPTGMVD